MTSGDSPGTGDGDGRLSPDRDQLRIALMTSLVQPAARSPVDPRAFFILVLCIPSGITLLLSPEEPPALQATLPSWAIMLWAFSLGVGALVTLLGVVMSSITGILIEQIGSVWVGSAAIVYGVAVLAVGGVSTLGAVAPILGFGAACLYRWLQLQRLLKRVRKVLEA